MAEVTSGSRRDFIRQTVGAATLPLLAGRVHAAAPSSDDRPAPVPDRPNLLFLWTDQHRGDVMPSSGDTAIRAPHLQALAERSFVFQRAYCVQPVCTPSRGSILTGLLPHRHGATDNNVPLRPDARTLAEYLSSDYATGYFGKWHLGDELLPQHGFREWRSIEDGYRQHHRNSEDRKKLSTYHRYLAAHGFPPDVNAEGALPAMFSRTMAAALPERYTKAAYLANEAESFLRTRRDGRPFVLSVNTLEPHPPTYGPLNGMYDPAKLPVGPAFARPVDATASFHHRRRAQKFNQEGYKNHPVTTEADWRRLRANYYGLVSMVDSAFGRILKALEESGQAERTIIVYTSDHGEMLGDHAMMGKGVFYEPAVRIPLLIHVPWLSRRRVDFRGPFSQIDLTPTLLELLGRPISEVDGVSRAGWLRRGAAPDEDVVVLWNEYDDEGDDGRCLVGADGWKLILYRRDGPELFDTSSDPGELVNRAKDVSQRDRVRRMAQKIKDWQVRTADTVPLMI
jgi:arylsulfatase A-like enzyme